MGSRARHRAAAAARAAVVVSIAALGALATAGGAASAGGGGCYEPASETRAGTAVEIRKACFSPQALRVEPGATVTWTNHDEVPHNVVDISGAWGDAQPFGRGESVSFTFDEPGAYLYLCTLHARMVGAVIVEDGAPITAAATAALAEPRSSDRLPWVLLGTLAGGTATAAGGVALARRR